MGKKIQWRGNEPVFSGRPSKAVVYGEPFSNFARIIHMNLSSTRQRLGVR